MRSCSRPEDTEPRSKLGLSILHSKMRQVPDLGLLQLQAAFADGLATPTTLLEQLYPLLAATSATFIQLFPLADILKHCRCICGLQCFPQAHCIFSVPYSASLKHKP